MASSSRNFFESRWVFWLTALVSSALGSGSSVPSAFSSAPKASAVQQDRTYAKSHVPAQVSADGSNSSKALVNSTVEGSATENHVQSADLDDHGEWRSMFSRGIHYSKQMVDTMETEASGWALDRDGSLAAVPQLMLLAEQLMRRGTTEASPNKTRLEKRAEEALRLYYHAKWLAERNLARGAEWRYREASRIAKEAKRSVLAAHALSRLGYFLMHWRRLDEAREVLRASETLNTKANPLGPFLFGMLERQVAGADTKRLLAAEERILRSAKQPSEDLEVQRIHLQRDIEYWRSVENSPRACLETANVAHLLICLCSHLAGVLQGVMFEGPAAA